MFTLERFRKTIYLQRDYLTQKASARSGQNSHILQGFFSHHKMVNISQNIDIKYIVNASKSNICLRCL